jgi:hypothetical protein
MFRPFGTIFRGSVVNETCFTVATDLRILNYTIVTTKRVKIRFLNIVGNRFFLCVLYLLIDTLLLILVKCLGVVFNPCNAGVCNYQTHSTALAIIL